MEDVKKIENTVEKLKQNGEQEEIKRIKEELKEMLEEEIHSEVHNEINEDKKKIIDEGYQILAAKKGISLSNEIPIREKNKIMMQYFEWYLPNDGKLWENLANDSDHLTSIGVAAVWIPPCYKAISQEDVGYGVYDLYDLGEFDQKGTVRTKYGDKIQLLHTVKTLHSKDIKVYADVVLNHRGGADETERFKVVQVDPENRNHEISEPYEIEGWTKFTFPGRNGKYSEFQWSFVHFTACDFDHRTGEKGIFKILGENKSFSDSVDTEKGNYDYLMHSDIDYRNTDVIDETIKWGKWFAKELDIDGMRFDAIKHIDGDFIRVFLREIRLASGKSLYAVGEYWNADETILKSYIQDSADSLALFDVRLHYNFFEAANTGADFDMRTIFDNTLLSESPLNVVTFVDNHDSQPGQSLESWIADWFKPLAYALILLRKDGYPCLFYGDYYGAGGANPVMPKKEILDPLLKARLDYSYGDQVDYFDDPNCIAWIRKGDPFYNNSGLAVIMSNGEASQKLMSFGPDKAKTKWSDITGNISGEVILDENGNGLFACNGGSVSVYYQV
jgi:alpha-amylase